MNKQIILMALLGLTTFSTESVVNAHKVEETPSDNELESMRPESDEQFEPKMPSDTSLPDDDLTFKIPEDAKMNFKEKVLGFFKHEPAWYIEHCKIEMFWIAILLASFIKYSMGRSANKSIAENFAMIVVPTLFNEFPHLGCNSEGRSQQIVEKSAFEYIYFASGRKNCIFAEFRLSLIRRQCVMSNIYDIVSGNSDIMTIDIPIDVKDRNVPLEFLICKKRDLKGKLKEFDYLNDMVYNSNTKNYKPDAQFKNAFMVMSEHDEIASQLIDARVGTLLSSQKDQCYLQELHVTDQKTYNNMGLMMRATLRLPQE
jgi:hypothetical protein